MQQQPAADAVILIDDVSDPAQDERYMRRALELARASVGLASPNPQVGCVLVRDGVMVGEGAHFYDEFDHAEVVALKQAGQLARGSTAYVTLEPCSHHGRTGPCAAALVAAGVRRVVAATVDPNPLVTGKGIRMLRDAGVEVEVGVCEQEARDVNEAFARYIRTGRPLVTLKAALSADGMLAPKTETRTKREPYWLTGPVARAEVQRMRHGADAVLTGIGTVLADDPALTDRTGSVGPGGRTRRRPLLRVVLDSMLRVPLESQLVQSANRDVLVLCSADVDAAREWALEDKGVQVERIAGQGGRLELGAVLDLLRQRQILSLLLECGSALNGAFLAQGLVDRVVFFWSQSTLGEGAVPFAVGGSSAIGVEEKLRVVARTAFGEDTRVSGLLRDPWAEPVR